MMKESRKSFGWRAVVGTLAVAGLALGLSLRLEGAAHVPGGAGSLSDPKVTITADEAKQINRQVQAQRQGASGEPVVYGNLANLMDGNIPTFPVIIVDYRDDDATRMREAGLLSGPLPLNTHEGGVAAGGCSFAVDCDDGNRCTVDTCDFTPGQPAGSGVCEHVPGDSSIGNPQCPGHFGLLCGGCDDGLFCNGVESCSGGACVAGTPPCTGIQVCSESFDMCQNQACTAAADCSNAGIVGADFAAEAALHCNGVESCSGGVCVGASNPCGSGAVCGERRCTNTIANSIVFCLTDEDCIQPEFTGTCSIQGPACKEGRCCVGATEPTCSRRMKSAGRCVGGTNANHQCFSNAGCNSNNCNLNQSCDAVGGLWYGGDQGTLSGTGQVCPAQDANGIAVKCPKYSAGIAPAGPYNQLLGPISDSPVVVAPFGVALQKLGDDYTLSNPGVCVGGTRNGLGCGVNADCTGGGSCNLAGPSFMALDYLRFVGGSPATDRISFEFYDESGNFVEDLFFSGTAAFGLYPVLFDPPITIPAKGFVVQRVAPGFSPNARHVWASTNAVDVGANNANQMWVNNGPVASNFGTTGILAFELEGTKVTGNFGACCNDATGACTNNVINFVCRGQGNNFQGNGSTCPANCGVGACCAANGTCSVTTQGACSGTFQGFGTDCDADNGYDDGQQHCCPQPLASYTGADDCEDVTLHVITAPPIGETKVITITGDNSGATNTFANPDSCFDPSDDPNAEPGWWEGFTLVDDCTIIYVDHCCTDPVHRPAYRILYDSCPCGSSMFTTANPYAFPEPPDSRGLPYCAEDDNAWQSFGLLGPGTYYYPIYSALAGHHGQYQLHIVAKACSRAACCVQNQCFDNGGEGLTQFECDALGGVFLAPPHRSPAVNACVGTNGQPGSTCFTGSCCTGPGECFDVVLGSGATKADCDAQSGNFKGNIRCEGGNCQAGPIHSCNDAQDCTDAGVGGNCLADEQQEAQPSPCPICEIQGLGNCQPFDDTINFGFSDRHMGENGLLLADDVRPDGDTLSSVCVWGAYLDGAPDANPLDCAAAVNADHFRVRVYATNPSTGRTPGTLVGESVATSEKGVIQGSLLQTRVQVDVYGYQLVLSTPIGGLTPGALYWIEVSNDVSESLATCNWMWMEQQPGSGSYSYTGTEAGYAESFESPFDLSFCTNFSFAESTTGTQVGSCCTCDGSCTLKTFYDCASNNGVWNVADTTCAGVVCPSGFPANDECGNAAPIVAGEYIVNNQCASTDGYGPIPSDTGDTQLDFDVWYEFIAGSACDLVVTECRSGRRFDSMIAVYVNCPPGSPANCDKTVCPPCPLESDPNGAAVSAAHLAGEGRDDNCTGIFESDGNWVASEMILRNAVPGECFLLRIGSFPGSRGTANLDIVCPEDTGTAPDPVTGSSPDKTRFISFTLPNNSTGETALRVKLTSLHHVVPPYPTGTSTPFTLFEGMSVYVGPPGQYVESAATQTPFLASTTQCTPHYRDWNTVGLLHVTGAHILPSSIYHVEHLAAACNGSEGSASCSTGGGQVSTGTEIRTTRWGDVEIPYNPPSPTAQPDVGDISALVNKFRSALGAPIKARALLTGGDGFGNISIAPDMSFGHIAACVDGFRGLGYPFKPGKCATSNVACIANSECGANGPCNLYCP